MRHLPGCQKVTVALCVHLREIGFPPYQKKKPKKNSIIYVFLNILLGSGSDAEDVDGVHPDASCPREEATPSQKSTLDLSRSLVLALGDIYFMNFMTHADKPEEVVNGMTNIGLISALMLTMLSVSPGDAVGSALSDYITNEVCDVTSFFVPSPRPTGRHGAHSLHTVTTPPPTVYLLPTTHYHPHPCPPTQTCEHVHSFVSSVAIFCFLWATTVTAWIIAVLGLMETEHQGQAFIKYIGLFVIKMPMGLLIAGLAAFFWLQVWLMFTNLPLWMAITVTTIGCVMSALSHLAFAITIQGVHAAQHATAP